MNTEIKRTLIALSVAAAFALPATLVLGTGAAVAAPTATQLPGQGAFAKGSASSVTASNGAMTIKLNGNAVIDWGNGGTTINSGGTPGFNIGSQASVGFSGGSVLNIDQSGLPSQIYGHLSGSNSVFVANHSGIIVGPDAVITAGGVAGLIGNSLTGDTANFNGTTSSIAYGDTGGNVVSVAAGSKIHGTTVLIAGGNTVNVNLSGITSDNGISLRDGISSNGARSNGAASLTTSGNGTEAVLVRAAGNVTNSGNLTLAKSSTLAGALVNTGNLDSTAVGLNVASLNNSGNLDGADVNVGDVLKNAGTLSANSVTAGQVQDGNADPKPVSHMTVTGSLTSEHGISVYKNATLTVGGNLSSKVSGLSNYGGTISAGNVNVDDTLHNEGQFTANEISVHNANNAANGVSNSGNMTVYSIGTRGGLNNSGSINAGYSVSSTGDLANSGAIQAPHITAGTDIDNSGRLAGKSGAATAIITSGGAFTNESTGLVNAGTVVVGGDMTNLNKVDVGSVKVAGRLTNRAGNFHAGSVTSHYLNNGAAGSTAPANMTVTGSLTSANISNLSDGYLTVHGTIHGLSSLANYGHGTVSAGNVDLDDTLHNEGHFVANEITVHNANNATDGVINSGTMSVYSIGTRGGLDNSGSINAGYSVSSTGDLDNSGAIQAPHITAGTDIDNSGRLAGKSGAATAIITSGGAFTNESTGLVNAGTVVVGGDMTNLNKVDIGSVKVAGTLTNRAGNFHAGSVTSHYLENGSPGSTSPANMTVSGSLTSANIHNFSDGYLTVHGTIHGLSSLANYGHGTVSAGNVDLDDTLLNEGQFVANEVSVHNANNATNGVINSGNMSIYSIGTRGGLSNSGNINAGYSVSSTTTVTNTGHITAKHVTANGNPVTGPGITITP